MSSPQDPPSPLQITPTVQARIDAFLKDILDIHELSVTAPAATTLVGIATTEVAVCDAIEVAIRRRRNERTLFSRLLADGVHLIFESALDLDRIHDPHFPLNELGRHRHQLFRMRRVSTAWNNFLLSSPQYWRVIDIKSSPTVISTCLERSGSATLCIYCIRTPSQPTMQTNMMPEALQSSVTRVQTFRSDDPGAYPVCRWLIQTRTPALQTLNFVAPGSLGRQQTLTWPWGDPSPIRHLITEGWQPSSDALWLAGLKELILTRLMEINTNTLQVLSACTSLERLSIQCDDFTVAEFPGAPPSITLPFVETMDLKFGLDESAVNLIRRLLTPRCLQRSLEITAVPLRLDEFAADYCNFLSPEEIDTRYPSSASIHMESRKPGTAHLVYKTESRRVAFGLLSWEEEVDSFYDLVQEFQELLDEPPLTVTTVDPSEVNNIFLRPFSDEDVRAIRAHFKVVSVHYLLALIGSQSNKPSFGPVTRNSTADWNFESLKSLEIHGADLNVSQITRLVGIRWKYLQKNSKTWLEEIDLVNCRLRGMRLGKAVKQLAAIGVTLRGIGCTRV